MWERVAIAAAATAPLVSACGSAARPVAVGEPQATTVAAEELVFEVFPFTLPRQVDATYGPLVVALGDRLDRPVRLRTSASFEPAEHARVRELAASA